MDLFFKGLEDVKKSIKGFGDKIETGLVGDLNNPFNQSEEGGKKSLINAIIDMLKMDSVLKPYIVSREHELRKSETRTELSQKVDQILVECGEAEYANDRGTAILWVCSYDTTKIPKVMSQMVKQTITSIGMSAKQRNWFIHSVHIMTESKCRLEVLSGIPNDTFCYCMTMLVLQSFNTTNNNSLYIYLAKNLLQCIGSGRSTEDHKKYFEQYTNFLAKKFNTDGYGATLTKRSTAIRDMREDGETPIAVAMKRLREGCGQVEGSLEAFSVGAPIRSKLNATLDLLKTITPENRRTMLKTVIIGLTQQDIIQALHDCPVDHKTFASTIAEALFESYPFVFWELMEDLHEHNEGIIQLCGLKKLVISFQNNPDTERIVDGKLIFN